MRRPLLPGPAYWLGAVMAIDNAGIPTGLGFAIRIAIFWGAIPFVGILLGWEDLRKGEYGWGIGQFCIAFLSIALSVYWELFSQKRAAKYQKLKYLSGESTDLGSAIKMMAWYSAEGKWFAAQHLATTNRPIPEKDLMHWADMRVWQQLKDGELSARGQKLGELDYQPIPREHWHSTFPHMIPDDASLWRMILVPTGGIEFMPDGAAINPRDASAQQRTEKLSEYENIIIESRQFEALWPRKDRKIKKITNRFLKTAKKAGADPAEIEKLSQD